eukprot:217287-Chlamydomonas_euryale.AAC.1
MTSCRLALTWGGAGKVWGAEHIGRRRSMCRLAPGEGAEGKVGGNVTENEVGVNTSFTMLLLHDKSTTKDLFGRRGSLARSADMHGPVLNRPGEGPHGGGGKGRRLCVNVCAGGTAHAVCGTAHA